MLKKIGLLFIVLLLSWQAVASQTNAAKQIAQAETYMNRFETQKALAILEPLAKQGNASAQNSLAAMYYQGKGVPRNIYRAEALFQESCNNGLQRSCWILKQMNNQ